MKTPLTVRFAPSPTGFLHLGSARTALFNWLAARSSGGRFLLRVEDTDKVRSEQRFLDEILEDLAWLGLDWDGEPMYQSRRFDLYREKADPGGLRPGLPGRGGDPLPVDPGRKIAYDDLIHGRIEVDGKHQGPSPDQVRRLAGLQLLLRRRRLRARITHILRGDDHISNTPKQILSARRVRPRPAAVRTCPILGPDGSKLSKRHGGNPVAEYKAEGFPPEALATTSISSAGRPDGCEILGLAEAARLFSIDRMNDVQAKFDLVKLKWMNGEYIMAKETAALVPLIQDQLRRDGYDFDVSDGARWAAVVDLYKIRIKTLRELGPMIEFFFREDFPVDEEGRKKHLGAPEKKALLADLASRLEALPEFSAAGLEELYRGLAAERNIKVAELIHPSRMAVSGLTKGAGLFEIMAVLGRGTVVDRLRRNSL